MVVTYYVLMMVVVMVTHSPLVGIKVTRALHVSNNHEEPPGLRAWTDIPGVPDYCWYACMCDAFGRAKEQSSDCRPCAAV
jgi:hypothetical protein